MRRRQAPKSAVPAPSGRRRRKARNQNDFRRGHPVKSTQGQSERRVFMTVFPTALGWMAGVWRGETVAGLVFNYPDPQAALSALTKTSDGDQTFIVSSTAVDDEPTAEQATLIARLVSYAQGGADDFRDLRLDDSHLTPFQRRVIHYCRRIPTGKVLSYGQLAQKAGSPGAARAVGQVMRTNRWPLIVPCHRVVGAGGTLGGYSAPEGLALKRRLLEREGALAHKR
jgi:methylated-DNA-[protein]-cysteine S-methyltransferase